MAGPMLRIINNTIEYLADPVNLLDAVNLQTLQAYAGNTVFDDSLFRIYDNVDATKLIAFEASGITTATTRTITMVDFSGTQVLSNGALTTGRIPFSGATGLQDSANLFWDITNSRLGIGTTSPAEKLHLPAGTATAGTAPLRLTSGTSLTTAVAGNFEFTTDNLFFTITTGAARKRLLMADAVGGLTSARVPFATTNGRLTDSANMTYTTNRLSPTYITTAAQTIAAGTAPWVMTTSASLMTTPAAGSWEYSTPYIYFTNSFLVRNKITQSQQFLTGSSFTKTADTTQSLVTGLSAGVIAGNNYRVEVRLHIDADATGGFDIGFNGTATLSSITAELMYFDNSGTNNFSRRITSFPGSFGGHAGSTEGFMMIQGFFRANTSGTFEVVFGQDVASGSSSVLARSTFEVYQG